MEKAPSKTGGGSRTSRAGGGPTRSAETAGQLQSAGSRAAEGGGGGGARARGRRWGRRWVLTRSTWACGSGIGELQAHRDARGAAAGWLGNGCLAEARCSEEGHGAGGGGVGAQPPVAGA